MSATIKKTRTTDTAESYFALIRKHSLKAIQNQHEYDAASAVLDRLSLRDDRDVGEEQYLQVLEVLVTAYDDKHDPQTPDTRTPLERLKALLQSSGTNQAELQSILGASQSMTSMILGGHRELSKKAVAKLSQHFKLEPGYFL